MSQKNPLKPKDMKLCVHLLQDNDCSSNTAKERIINLRNGRTTVIGRDGNSDVQLVDSNVSRAHAKIDIDKSGGAMISDLSSANGTKVNGRIIKPHAAIQAGDIIELGKVRACEERSDEALRLSAHCLRG